MKLKVSLVMGNKKVIVKKTAILMIFAAGLVLALFFAEIMVRKFVNFPIKKEYGKFLHLAGFSIPKASFNESLFWMQGEQFRGGKHTKEKKQGFFRIICLGDSVTQGHGIGGSALPRADAYPFFLEKLLQESYKNREIEVINAGVGGYSTFQGLRYLNSLIEYNPSLIISWFGVNDDSDALFFVDKDQRLESKEDFKEKSFLAHSKLYLFLKNVIFRPRLRRVSFEDYYKNCESMLLLARKNNAEVVFVVPFEIENRKIKYYLGYKNALEKLSNNYNCTIIDITRLLSTHNRIDDFFIDNCHATAQGNKLIAEALKAALEKRKVIKTIK